MSDTDTCSIRGCDRLASHAADSDGDLCGDHRTAEHALGRRPVPEPTADTTVTYHARAAATAAVVASLLCERLAANLGRHSHVVASPKMQAVIAADRASAAKALRDLAWMNGVLTSYRIDGGWRTAHTDAVTVERTTDADEGTRIARAWAAWAARVDP